MIDNLFSTLLTGIFSRKNGGKNTSERKVKWQILLKEKEVFLSSCKFSEMDKVNIFIHFFPFYRIKSIKSNSCFAIDIVSY